MPLPLIAPRAIRDRNWGMAFGPPGLAVNTLFTTHHSISSDQTPDGVYPVLEISSAGAADYERSFASFRSHNGQTDAINTSAVVCPQAGQVLRNHARAGNHTKWYCCR